MDAVTPEERYDAWDQFVRQQSDATIPHCDSRILHHPTECTHCSRPAWQRAREQLGIAFTGRAPVGDEVFCEADLERPPGTAADHRRWGGNKPTSAVTGSPTPLWPMETFSSVTMYGDMGGRGAWPEAVTNLRDQLRRPWYNRLLHLYYRWRAR